MRCTELTSRLLLSLFSLLIFNVSITARRNEITNNRCEVKAVADYDFFRIIGNSNYASASRYLINLIERLNQQIFSPVDWGHEITGKRLINIGFSIKEIKVFNQTTSDLIDHFNSERSSENGTYDPKSILESFSREEGTNSTCLTLLVSAKLFSSQTLGLAYIGRSGERGICAKHFVEGIGYTNTAIMTVRRPTGLLITREVDLLAAHEIGHSMGSLHDDQYEYDYFDDRSDSKCMPNNSEGRYVMNGSPNSGYEQNNYVFSECSMTAIQKTLYSLASKCFVHETTALCGNGILEPENGEECDIGNQINALNNPCCTEDCRLRPGARCSPNHDECCTETCQIAPRTQMCQTKSDDVCRNASYCNGVSESCPPAESLSDGTVCEDEGRCMNGKCISFCESQSPDLAPCLCKLVNETCHRCCRIKTIDACTPFSNGTQLLPEGSICIEGTCQKNAMMELVCERQLTDITGAFWAKIIKNIKENPKPKIFTDFFVFIIISISLLLWCPCSALIVYNDNQKHQQLSDQSRCVEDRVEYILLSKRHVSPRRFNSKATNEVETAFTE